MGRGFEVRDLCAWDLIGTSVRTQIFGVCFDMNQVQMLPSVVGKWVVEWGIIISQVNTSGIQLGCSMRHCFDLFCCMILRQ